MKKYNYWKIICVLLLTTSIFAFVPTGNIYSQVIEQQPTQDGDAVRSDDHALYLPIIMGKPKSSISFPGSPFSIQIAGLHEITVDSASTLEIQESRDLARAELDRAFPDLIEALGILGAGAVRVYIDWAAIEEGKGEYDWNWYDEKLALIADTRMRIIATVSNPPIWAWVDKSDPCNNAIENPQDYYDFLEKLVYRYSIDRSTPVYIDTWEILNEPDANPGYRCGTGVVTYGQTGAQYADLAKRSSEIIKQINPKAKVIMGGIAYDSFWDDDTNDSDDPNFSQYFVDDLMNATSGAGLDALNFHYFRDFRKNWERWSVSITNEPNAIPNPPTCIDEITEYPVNGLDVAAKLTYFDNRMKVCHLVDKSIWISEIGHHGTTDEIFNTVILEHNENANPEDYDMDEQAYYVFKGNARALAYGAENVTWYSLKIVRAITLYDYQGLLDDDNNPKRAFWAYQTLTNELAGYSYAYPNDWVTGDDWWGSVESYVFQNDAGDEKIIAWVNPDHSTYITDGAEEIITPREITISASSLTLVYPPDIDLNYDPIPNLNNKTIQDGGEGDLDEIVNDEIKFLLGDEPVVIY